MDLTQAGIIGAGGIGIEPMLEHAVINHVPDALKPAVAWIAAAAYGIGMNAAAGGDWKQAVATTVATVVYQELKHQSPWGTDATPAPGSPSALAAAGPRPGYAPPIAPATK
jgi:hypothetical protein